MVRIITYRNDSRYGFCQIELDSGEKVLLSEASDFIKIMKLSFGFLPIKTVWQWHRTEGPKEPIAKMLEKYPNQSFFDSFVHEIMIYKSIIDLQKNFGK